MSNNNKEDKYNFGSDNSEAESYIYEECFCCGKDMIDIKDIFVDINDHYVCHKCANTYRLNVVRCAEY